MVVVLVLLIILILLILFLFFAIVLNTIEHYHLKLFNKPVFIHFYISPKIVSEKQRNILKNKIQFYNKLDTKRKRYFEHRVAKFISHYQFVSKEDLVVTDEMKLMIAGTAVKVTFGMRKYLLDVFDKIILYPSIYYSTVNDAWHKGEFNPRMKALVFSWQDFLNGYEYENDNLNLGIHEFAHAAHLHGLKRTDASSLQFAKMYVKIREYIEKPEVLDKLVASNYFRIYAYTNHFEFIAVILEHFFETPEQFKEEHPELFNKVRKMINL
ncbi:zinc-dependent peptidase [Flavobacterium sp. UBA6135]|uniref:zinc-dependent peptidase n=1 Tax=Flavobacterium sp. UBA6135 TaxID=1946553 RepID=UPI0025C4DB12|nr:zinc-dependent peptidase [Flavobacterium sp. UBA6135]